jgi:hypothetical protein
MVLQPSFLTLDAFVNGLSKAGLDTDGNTLEMIGRGHYGFVDKAGRFAVEPRYRYVERFSEGLARVTIGHAPAAPGMFGLRKWRAERAGLRKPDTNGYVRPDGAFAVEPVYTSAGSFSDGLACVGDASGYWYIDHGGNKVFGPFESAHDFSGGVAVVTCRPKGLCLLRRDGTTSSVQEYGHGVSFFNGCGRVQVYVGKFVGYLDTYGNVAVAPAFSAGSTFREDRAAVKVKRKWGAIDPAGNLVVELAYDESFLFHDGVALVQRDGERMFIDLTGNVVLRPKYEPDDVFREGLAIVRMPVN